ncbi:hypothetical protein KEJ37_06930 [Candidatus Bathyarchaeota archaeon]|nr:hypothetical protein [Candidatus Bathyarchaeota archaeon]
MKIIFDSERCNYPISQGKRGPAYLLNAITEIAFGRDIELVLADYQLKRKSGPKVQIVEKLQTSEAEASVKSVEKLHEILGDLK